MSVNKSDAFITIKDKLSTAWNWPPVPGAGYTREERKSFRRLSDYFSSTAGIAIGTATVATIPCLTVIG